MKFDHIGIFVEELHSGYDKLSKLFRISRKSIIFDDPLLRVSVQFFYDEQGICYELVAPNGADSPVDSVLKNGTTSLNHIAYKTNEFDNTISNLRKGGCVPLGIPQPALAFEGARVIFFLTPLKLIFELIEDINGDF